MSNDNIRNIIIGLGHDYRQDDGVGLYVVRSLANKSLVSTYIVECYNEVDIIQSWSNAPNAIIIDACHSGNKPGTLYTFDALKTSLPPQCGSLSSHKLDLSNAITMSKLLDSLPESLTLYLIEGKQYDYGNGLSDEVRISAQKLINHLATNLR